MIVTDDSINAIQPKNVVKLIQYLTYMMHGVMTSGWILCTDCLSRENIEENTVIASDDPINAIPPKDVMKWNK